MRKYGTPEIVISDNATTFVGKEFQALLERRGVKHWPNARHHSQANPVERLNRTINACLRTYMKEDQRIWDTRVTEIEEMVNTTVHSSTKMSPYRILFGHEQLMRGEEHRLERDEKVITMEERANQRSETNRKIFELVQKNLTDSHEKTRKTYNLRHKKFAPTYQVGQKVLKKNFRQSSAVGRYNAKYGPVYTPCIVAAKRGSSSYELVDEHGKKLGVFSSADLRVDVPIPQNSCDET